MPEHAASATAGLAMCALTTYDGCIYRGRRLVKNAETRALTGLDLKPPTTIGCIYHGYTYWLRPGRGPLLTTYYGCIYHGYTY